MATCILRRHEDFFSVGLFCNSTRSGSVDSRHEWRWAINFFTLPCSPETHSLFPYIVSQDYCLSVISILTIRVTWIDLDIELFISDSFFVRSLSNVRDHQPPLFQAIAMNKSTCFDERSSNGSGKARDAELAVGKEVIDVHVEACRYERRVPIKQSLETKKDSRPIPFKSSPSSMTRFFSNNS